MRVYVREDRGGGAGALPRGVAQEVGPDGRREDLGRMTQRGRLQQEHRQESGQEGGRRADAWHPRRLWRWPGQ